MALDINGLDLGSLGYRSYVQTPNYLSAAPTAPQPSSAYAPGTPSAAAASAYTPQAYPSGVFQTPGGQTYGGNTPYVLPGGQTPAQSAAQIPVAGGSARMNPTGSITLPGGQTYDPNATSFTAPGGGQTISDAQLTAMYNQTSGQLGITPQAARTYNPSTSSSPAMDAWSGYEAWDPTMVNWSTASVPDAAKTYWQNLHPEWFS